MLSVIDGNWFDFVSLAGGVVFAVHRCKKGRPTRKVISRETGMDIASGVSLFPLAILILGSMSTQALSLLTHSSRLTLAVAGIFAILAIVED